MSAAVTEVAIAKIEMVMAILPLRLAPSQSMLADMRDEQAKHSATRPATPSPHPDMHIH